ncbi:TPA: transporter substrate-binding domain-containing protein [Legionella pneumophila]|nr:transporter substrate-binding domain-containing protein [Legionella pneumophila]HAT8642497.1 transporter substrate-binding domain-containing protein [Legionella pneumophila]HAT8868798.1 transporter substrate-binding domain-containing protein [Legionella pneumophila subsp. pneumophila]HAT8890430.1 transporter substrate-binding domain-containing protein [Legionella pneumophila subsp. pneumophila]HAT8934170.1 transporter substrate-binding domain-containing protein [Legionella pneumophila subsp.
MKLLQLLLFIIISSNSYSLNLTIGTSKFNPPFEVWSGNNSSLYGFDIDLMQEICRRLHAACTFKAYIFDDLFPALKNREVDLVIASMIITDERKKHFIFSLPYMESNSQYITTVDSKINTFDDLHGQKIGVRKGTPYARQVLSENRNNQVIFYELIQDMLLGLSNNEVDASLMDYEAAKYWMASEPYAYKLIGKKISIGEGYSVMANPDQFVLIKKINKILLEMEADGTYLRLYHEYF